MFLENKVNRDDKKGWVEVICGSMFSGKTEELLRRLKRAKIARQKVEIFKPMVDVRYSDTEVVSHDANAITSTPVESSGNILLLSSNVEVVGIDEAQFFDKGLVDVCHKLASQGIRVIVAGLDMDFKGVPFGPIPGLLATAEYVTKVHAICMRCGDLANFSHRLSDDNKLVVLGEKNEYEPLCRGCFTKAHQKV
ncbi:MAG: thymidine kinase [Marinilabiliaceae bacterium]|nr:thymidine kinase [Marinilabiliaceae bacterium]